MEKSKEVQIKQNTTNHSLYICKHPEMVLISSIFIVHTNFTMLNVAVII